MDATINHWMVKSQSSGTKPEDLYEDAKKYFMWCEANPIYKEEMIKQTGALVPVTYPRPFNLPALCIHCGITVQYIMDMAKNPNAGEYNKVAQWILEVIYSQNLEYAMVGIFNSNITMKKLNLGSQDEAGKMPAIIKIEVVTGDAPQLEDNEFENVKSE